MGTAGEPQDDFLDRPPLLLEYGRSWPLPDDFEEEEEDCFFDVGAAEEEAEEEALGWLPTEDCCERCCCCWRGRWDCCCCWEAISTHFARA